MPWIKRNLYFVVTLAVGVILTGYCAFLLYKDLGDNQSVQNDFSSAATEYGTLQAKSPYPSDDNIKRAKEDQAQVKAFLGEFKTIFVNFPPPPKMDDKTFNTYVNQTIADLKLAATNAGVQMPDDFQSFKEQGRKLTYAAEDIPLWLQQIAEIKAICGILFKSKINFLEMIQRVQVSENDSGSPDLLGGVNVVSNQTQITVPYKIAFKGFSPEIAAVLEGFARSSNCIIVKTIDVRASTDRIPDPPTTATPAQTMPPPGFGEYNRGGPPGGRPMFDPRMGDPRMRPMPAPDAPVSNVPRTVLTERPLHVTITLELVKFKVPEH